MIQDFDWEELLLLIGDRQVIPVVGREMLRVHVQGEPVLLEHYLADRLAEELAVSSDDLTERPDVNEVAVVSLRASTRRASSQQRHIRKTLVDLVAAADVSVPEPLLKLAEITDFDLFLSTTFDDLLCRALDRVRHGGDARTRTLAYRTLAQEDDLPDDPHRLDTPHVYHIFGNLASQSDFAVTDEDGLEVLHRLQGSRHQPRRLFDELRERNLLFLGCGLPDGLARILVRTLGNQRLFPPNKTYKVIDGHATGDANLSRFLRLFDAETHVDGGVAAFVDELVERWKKTTRGTVGRRPSHAAAVPALEGASVFLSYKSEDLPRARRLAEALRDAGLQVWFDKHELQGGDAWDLEIEKGIAQCTIFLPVVSRKAQVVEGEFRREWARALKRAERMPPEVPFIIAVLLDPFEELQHKEGEREPLLVPREFWTKQYLTCCDDVPTQDFVEVVRAQVREVQLLKAGRLT